MNRSTIFSQLSSIQKKFMINRNELNEDILKITQLNNDKYPELSKFIEEMPVTIPNKNTPEVNVITFGKLLQFFINYGKRI
jgi:hypothetical protein